MANAADADSKFVQIPNDVSISGTAATPLLQVNITGGRSVFLAATGSFAPGVKGRATVYISLDGKRISNPSTIDWTGAVAPVEHSFQAIGAVPLPAGPHVVSLTATGTGNFVVKKGSSLAVMLRPAASVSQSSLAAESATITLPTAGIVDGKSALPTNAVLSLARPASLPRTVVMASGSADFAGTGEHQYGDSMWSLLVGGKEIDSDSQAYAANDIWFKSELTAPLYVHALVDPGQRGGSLSLSAAVEPWMKSVGVENPVHYKAAAGTTLVALSGGIQVTGGASNLGARDPAQPFRRFQYKCIASTKNSPGCPSPGTGVTISQGTVTIPPGHNGVVYFSAIARLQGANGDGGGRTTFRIVIDGQDRGSIGAQVLDPASAISTRTVALGYLATGAEALSPGQHKVALVATADGDYLHIATARGMSLMWFD